MSHVVVWCASVLLLSLPSGCVISRVCMWAFHSYLLYTLCLYPLKAVWVLCLCRFVGFFFFFTLLQCFFNFSTPIRPLPWQTTARAAKIMSQERNLFCRCAMSLHWHRLKTCSSSLNQTEMTYRDGSQCEMLIFPRPKVSGVSGAIWVKG